MNRYLTIITLAVLWPVFALAGIIRVPQDQPSIQDGINAAVNGDTVLVADSTYYENIDFGGKAITVASYMILDNDTTHRDNTIINGSQPHDPNKGAVVSFVSGEDSTSVLYGFTITGGSGTWYSVYQARAGGGISCDNSGCKIIANKIIINSVTGSVALGGGVAAVPMGSTAYMVLEDNQITQNMVKTNNTWAQGGGVFLNSNAKLTANLISYNTCISDTMSSNPITWGSGISCLSLSPNPPLDIIIENNTITHNSVINYSNVANAPAGSAVFIENCRGRMSGNEISYNEIWNYSNVAVGSVGVGVGDSDSFLVESNIIRNNAYMQGAGDCYGGGIQVFGTGIISVINNLIEGNIATYGGGVVVANNIPYSGKAILVNNTIVNNTAAYGGGIYVHESTAYVMNSIIWGNQAPTNAAIHTYNSTIAVAYSDVQGGYTGTGNINADPQFDPTNPYHLTANSPCRDAATMSYNFSGMVCNCPPEDIDREPRPFGALPDIGADEFYPVAIEPQPMAEIPQTYALHQNYPNPFNPSTTIEFALPKAGFVTLTVYNVAGEKVTTLVSENLAAGSYKYQWDARGLASGVYFYKLWVSPKGQATPSGEAGNFIQTRKMLLIR